MVTCARGTPLLTGLSLTLIYPVHIFRLLEERWYPGYRSRRHHVELRQRVEEEIDHLNPRLEKLAEGEVEVISVDEKTGTVTLRILGGRLH